MLMKEWTHTLGKIKRHVWVGLAGGEMQAFWDGKKWNSIPHIEAYS